MTIHPKLEIHNFNELSLKRLYQILEARQDVFTTEQKIIYTDPDYKDQQCWHGYTLTEDDHISSYLRILPPKLKFPEWSIGRVLTRKDFRGQGLSTKLLAEAVRFIQKQSGGHARIRISAQSYLEKFYTSIGYKTISEPYLEEGIEHLDMVYEGVNHNN